MADISILDSAAHAAPKGYTVAGSQEIVLKGVTASFDGTGAAGSWVPAFQVVDPSGHVAGTYTAGSTLAAGASADVSWFPGVGSGGSATRNAWFVIGSGSGTIPTGVVGDVGFDFSGTIVKWTLLAVQAGALVVDLWKVPYAGFPAGGGNSITGGNPPTIPATNQKAQSSTLTGWSPAITAGDTLRLNVNSVTTIQRATLILELE